MADELFELKKYSDINKLAVKYPRLLKVIIVSHENSNGGGLSAKYIIWEKEEDGGKYPGHGSGNTKWDNEYFTSPIKNYQDLKKFVSKNKNGGGWRYQDTWGGWKGQRGNTGLKDFLTLEAGRCIHLYGLALLSPKSKITKNTAKKQVSKETVNKSVKKNDSLPQMRVPQKEYRPRVKGEKQIEVTPKSQITKKMVGIDRDMKRAAKPVGRRISKSGNIYYEYRDNRSDSSGGMSDYYQNMSNEAILRLKKRGEYGVKYHGGELVTPEASRKKKPLSKADLLKVVAKYELQIHKQPVENLLYFDKFGNCISHNVGTQKSVSADVFSGNTGIALTHNHPSSDGKMKVPHSKEDIAVFLAGDAPIMRVCVYGKYYQYEKSGVAKLRQSEASKYAMQFSKILLNCVKEDIQKIAAKWRIGVKTRIVKGRVKFGFVNTLNLSKDEYQYNSLCAEIQAYQSMNGDSYVRAHKIFANTLMKSGKNIKFTEGEL